MERIDCRSDSWIDGVAAGAVTAPERMCAPGVVVAATMAAALLAGVLGVTAPAAAGDAGVSTDAALRVLPVLSTAR